MSTPGGMYEDEGTRGPGAGAGYGPGGAPEYSGGGGQMGAPYGGYGRRGMGGYGGFGMGMMGPGRSFPIETKPFFLTSEFVAALLTIIGLAIAAATDDSIDAQLFWTLTTAIVAFYMLSRGIAKSGTKSRAGDPREHLQFGRGEGGGGGG